MLHGRKQRKPERRTFAIDWVKKSAVGANDLMPF